GGQGGEGAVVPPGGNPASRRRSLDAGLLQRATTRRGQLPVRRQSRDRRPVRHEAVHAQRATACGRDVAVRLAAEARRGGRDSAPEEPLRNRGGPATTRVPARAWVAPARCPP